ncbi:hypothetical protein ANN_11597 [Periplaneta americana]|uniref:Reverse transcriptase domain-containing protein n=1 Tax=Periplaneta americana TaxID=6978 RepID=A0ABQ8T6U6_PERAM|nr:hypothetical protein ANN_11597 [Periplaneta americana]
MDLREVGYDDRDWINLAQDRDRWRAYVRTAMNLRVPYKPFEGFSCDSQITSLVQDLAEEVDRGGRIDAVVIDFSKAFDLVPHDILIDKLSRLGIDKRVVLWIQEFLKGRTQRVRVGHEISEIGNISSGVPQGSVLGPLLFIIYVNDLCQDITSNVRLFADDCIIYRKIRNNSDVDAIQTDLNNIYNWALKHRMKINGSKSKSITFCKTREETSLNYEFSGVVIPQEQCCKYLGVYLNSKLSWGEHVDNVTGKAWRALHFIMRILRKASPKSREIAYLTLVRPLMEYGTTCWDPYRIYQINSLERIQYRAAKFVKGKREDGNDTIKELKWETLENRRRKTRITSLYRAHLGQKAWVDITARLEKPTYYGRNDHDFKIKCRKQKTDVGASVCHVLHGCLDKIDAALWTKCVESTANEERKYLTRDNEHDHTDFVINLGSDIDEAEDGNCEEQH